MEEPKYLCTDPVTCREYYYVIEKRGGMKEYIEGKETETYRLFLLIPNSNPREYREVKKNRLPKLVKGRVELFETQLMATRIHRL